MRLEAVILPDLGTGPDVPIVVSHWFAARGDEVWEGDRLVEVLVGPATFDVPAPATGRLAEIRGEEDDQVAVAAGLTQHARKPHGRAQGNDELFIAERDQKGSHDAGNIVAEDAQRQPGQWQHQAHVRPTCDGKNCRGDNQARNEKHA